MIVITERNEIDKINTIHLIMGPETNFQMNMTGQIVIDISNAIDPNYKNVILMNPCDSEEELHDQIQHYYQKSQKEDFMEKMQEELDKSLAQEHNPPPPPPPNSVHHNEPPKEKSPEKTKQPDSKIDFTLACPKCGGKGTRVIRDIIDICDTCREIDVGLARNEIAPSPSVDDQIEILHSLTHEDDEFREETSQHLNRKLNSQESPDAESD